MPEYTGKDMAISWIHAGGTIALAGDYRTISSSPSIGLVDASAGSDADRTYLTTLKDGTYSLSMLAQTAGTVLRDALLEGTSGTLLIKPEGTASGKPSETVPCISMGPQFNFPYDNVVEITCQFQKNGARVLA